MVSKSKFYEHGSRMTRVSPLSEGCHCRDEFRIRWPPIIFFHSPHRADASTRLTVERECVFALKRVRRVRVSKLADRLGLALRLLHMFARFHGFRSFDGIAWRFVLSYSDDVRRRKAAGSPLRFSLDLQ